MLTGINCWALPSSMSLREQIRFAAEAGYDGIELTLTEDEHLPFYADARFLQSVRAEAQQAGIGIVSICCSLNWQCSFTSERKEIRDKALNNCKRQIEVAKALGAGAILSLPGFVGLDFTSRDLFADPNDISYFPGSEVIAYETAWERALCAYQELSSVARENEVLICVENIWSKFLLSPIEMKLFLDSIASPWVKAYLDVGNMMPYGYPEHWIQCLGRERIGRVHLKDYRRGVPGMKGFVPLLTGDVDFSKVMSSLRSIGYDGYLTVETNAYRHYPRQTAYDCMSAINNILNG